MDCVNDAGTGANHSSQWITNFNLINYILHSKNAGFILTQIWIKY